MTPWSKTILLLCASSFVTIAQEPSPASMVRTWTKDSVSPHATINDIRWLVGEWEGPLDGGMQQHISLAPVGGHMPGISRGWGQDGAIWFYEINDMVEVNGSLEFHVKHFSSELAGWEGQTEFVRHRLIEITDSAMYFDGITIVKEGPDHHTVYVRINDGDRKGQVLVVHQTRVSKH
jgi:hypothetical protein